MSKFTKGKWKVGSDGSGAVSLPDGKWITQHGSPYPPFSDEEKRANARLIAIAPEMYNTLVCLNETLKDPQVSSILERAEEEKVPPLLGRKWKYIHSGAFDIVSEPGHKEVAVVMCNVSYKEQESNARLIASAPDMYRLLKRFAECRHEDDMFDIMENAQELIARIDGTEAINE